MKKEDALKQYSDGLEETLNHPALLKDKTLKDMMKYIATSAFEMGWDVSTFDNISEEEKDRMFKKWKQTREKVRTYDGFVSMISSK